MIQIVRQMNFNFKNCNTSLHHFGKYLLPFVLINGVVLLLIYCSKNESMPSNSNQPWSIRMTDSEMKRNPKPWMIDDRGTPKWEYTQGLELMAILKVWEIYQKPEYLPYVLDYYDQFIRDDGSIWLYNPDDYNIDRINPGKPLFTLYKITGKDKFKKAIYLLRQQMKAHPRTKEGGFWHKKIYPNQMWLDGLYMASPFLAQFAQVFKEPQLFDDVANQAILMEKHTRDTITGLLYHGWDESRQQKWSDPKTGHSPNFWGRGMGWYSMALVDMLDFFPEDHPGRQKIIKILQRFANAIIQYQDPKTGLWYQVVDQGGREGNYLESSASCMFVYSLIKAVRKGYVDSTYMNSAQKGYNGILYQFIEVDPDGLVNIIKTCAVAGLGGDPYRDGSYEYYVGEKISKNDPKAVGPFVLASLEFETLEKNSNSSTEVKDH